MLSSKPSPKPTEGSTRTGSASSSSQESIQDSAPVLTKYESNNVPIPSDYLATPASGARPVTVRPIDWASTILPENEGRYAVVLDNVLSPSECAKLLQLAEASVPPRGPTARPWRPALVNIGGGYEVLEKDYRNSDRIIWDQQEVVDRLWARIAPSVAEALTVIDSDKDPQFFGTRRRGGGFRQRWEFRGLNKRMRFLKYGKGQFFRPHCDGPYSEEHEGKVSKTFFTLHVYLNDSVAEMGPGAYLIGGATSFLSSDESRKMDIDPKAGRVLIFQHRALYHSGDDVLQGTKYTMRTDICMS